MNENRQKKRPCVPKDGLEMAVALKYCPPQERAPRVVAKGSGFAAMEIIRLAKEHGIPLKEDADLVEILCKLELNQEIPEKLYGIIAELMVFVYKMNKLVPCL